jgi:nitrogen regulatory protein P-II 1
MRQVKAIIRSEMLSAVREALEQSGCYQGVTITDVMGHGAQKGITQAWRGEKYRIELLPKVMIDLVVKNEEVDKVKQVIIDSARTGEIGDGKIFVYDVVEVVRIRTGEVDYDAI